MMDEALSPGYVYLDYAASAPLCAEAAQAMQAFMQAGPAGVAAGTNPNSLSTPGRIAFRALESARQSVSAAIGAARASEIIFTSGATESDNTALRGIAAAKCAERAKRERDFVPEIITTSIEHDAVLNMARRMERDGYKVTYLRPNRGGFIEASTLEQALTPATVLVSIQMANSEMGAIQPLGDLVRVAHEGGALFHTDATQALGKVGVCVADLGVDAASFSAHKIGGPKGIGALYLRTRTPFDAQALGGGQEGARRSGTQNVPGAVGFAAAAEAAASTVEGERERLQALRERLYGELAAFEGVHPTVDVASCPSSYLPNIVNVVVDGIESMTLVLRFDALGFAVSGGSACSSSSLEPSHVLTSLGISADAAQGELRISLGRDTTDEDISAFIAAVPQVLSWQ